MKLPPADWWRTVFYLIPAVTLYTIGCGVVSLLSTFVDRSGHFAHRCARLWARLILVTSGVTVEVGGAPLPPATASCIFVANHSSIYDTPILFTSLPHQLRIMAKAALGRVPFIGWHLSLAGHLLVDRSRPGPAIMKKMQRMVRQGGSLIIFAEGSRTRDGSVGPFKGGIFLLAIESKLPIVPVSVSGSGRIMVPGHVTVSRGLVRVTVHPPIATAGMTRGDARALAERTREIVASSV